MFMAMLFKRQIILTIGFVAFSCMASQEPQVQDEQPCTQQEILDEATRLISTEPTGFTYLLKSGVHNIKALASMATHAAMHPIDTTIDVSSSIGGKARDLTTSGLKKGFYVARHPLEVSKKIISIIRHPIDDAKSVLSFCDHIDFNNFPVIGRFSRALRQFGGMVPITQENCPELYDMLQSVAQKVGVEIKEIYVFKGNFLTNLAESFESLDFSCNAFQTGFTTGTSYIVIGKDLLLGVNRGTDSFVPGMTLEQIQAVFAHELAHQKNRHLLKMLAVTGISAALAYYIHYLINTKAIIPCGDNAVMVQVSGKYMIVSANVVLCYLLENYALPLVTNAFSRKCEKEADMDAASSLNDEEALAEGLSKLYMLHDSKHRTLAQLFKSHPDLGARVGYLHQARTQRSQTSK